MNLFETYLVDGKHLSADQCRALFAGMSLLDRQIKVLERIEGDTIIDIGCHTGIFVHAAGRRFPDKSVIGLDYSEDIIRIARLLYPDIQDRFRRMSIIVWKSPTRASIASPCRRCWSTWRGRRWRSRR